VVFAACEDVAVAVLADDATDDVGVTVVIFVEVPENSVVADAKGDAAVVLLSVVVTISV
jgi:hypothetical protein